jgi:hypothetical protein
VATLADDGQEVTPRRRFTDRPPTRTRRQIWGFAVLLGALMLGLAGTAALLGWHIQTTDRWQ